LNQIEPSFTVLMAFYFRLCGHRIIDRLDGPPWMTTHQSQWKSKHSKIGSP